jgi:acyl carrier protein
MVCGMSTALRQLILDWLDDNYHFGEAARRVGSDDTSFLKNGILDSLGFLQLVLHLESTLGIKIDRKQLSPKNFDTLNQIIAYVTAHPGYRG